MEKVKIQVLGLGCPQCRMLAENVKKAVKELGLNCEIIMSMDIDDIRRFGMAMTTPALMIDGKIEIAGKMASVEEIKKLILEKLPIFG